MKKLLTILCLVLLSSYSYSKEVLLDQLVERDGMYYEVNSNTPFTGSVENYYENGQLERKGNVKNGKPNGLWEYFYENSQLRNKGNFKEGNYEGLWEGYDEKGKLKESGNYKNGKRDGIVFFYKWDIETVVYYIDGKDTRRRQYYKKRPNDKKSWDEFCRGYDDGYLVGGLGTPGMGSIFCPDQPRKLSNISDYDHGYSVGEEQGQTDQMNSYFESFDY